MASSAEPAASIKSVHACVRAPAKRLTVHIGIYNKYPDAFHWMPNDCKYPKHIWFSLLHICMWLWHGASSSASYSRLGRAHTILDWDLEIRTGNEKLISLHLQNVVFKFAAIVEIRCVMHAVHKCSMFHILHAHTHTVWIIRKQSTQSAREWVTCQVFRCDLILLFKCQFHDREIATHSYASIRFGIRFATRRIPFW